MTVRVAIHYIRIWSWEEQIQSFRKRHVPTYLSRVSSRYICSRTRFTCSFEHPPSNVFHQRATTELNWHTQLLFNLSVFPPAPTLPLVGHERDTMGSLIEPEMISPPLASPGMAPPGFETIHIQPEMPLPIVSPRHSHPLVHQDSLESQVRRGLSDTPVPFQTTNPGRLRVLSLEMPRESPILGLNSVKIQP